MRPDSPDGAKNSDWPKQLFIPYVRYEISVRGGGSFILPSLLNRRPMASEPRQQKAEHLFPYSAARSTVYYSAVFAKMFWRSATLHSMLPISSDPH